MACLGSGGTAGVDLSPDDDGEVRRRRSNWGMKTGDQEDDDDKMSLGFFLFLTSFFLVPKKIFETTFGSENATILIFKNME